MMNLGNPEEAFALSKIPNDGVGLARMEFIITNYIKVHPMALVHPERVADIKERQEIDRLTFGYPDRESYFVEQLAGGIATIAAAFHPKAGRGPDERFQDQRIRAPSGRQRL